MATRLRHYDGKFGPACPEGWRRVEVGEVVRAGDRWWHNEWHDMIQGGWALTKDVSLTIRRVDPVPAPVADVPASVGVPLYGNGEPVTGPLPPLPAGYRFATAADYAMPRRDDAMYYSGMSNQWEPSVIRDHYASDDVYALPMANAPAPATADCADCARLRAELDAANRRVEAEHACRRIAETACMSAERATVYHQSEAAKARLELDKERAAHEATSAQSMEAHALLGMKENECERLRADRMEAQRNTAIRDTAAALRVVRLMAKDGQEVRQ